MVRQVQNHIAANFTDRINVEEIARALNVSRRLLDKRYRQYTGESMMKTVEHLRMKKVNLFSSL